MTPPLRLPIPHLLRAGVAGLCIGGLFLACSGPTPNQPGTASGASAKGRVYHVQLQFTDDKDQAAAVLGRAQQWWQQQPPSKHPSLVEEVPSSDPPVTMVWKAPFYRVRLGPFATKEHAETVLGAARHTFSGAFVAPEQIENP